MCCSEIIAFSDAYPDFHKMGCEIIATSDENHFTHLTWVNTSRDNGGLGEINIPLFADKSSKIAKAYGVYNKEIGITSQRVFIIDRKQILRHNTINFLPAESFVESTFRLVQLFESIDNLGVSSFVSRVVLLLFRYPMF